MRSRSQPSLTHHSPHPCSLTGTLTAVGVHFHTHTTAWAFRDVLKAEFLACKLCSAFSLALTDFCARAKVLVQPGLGCAEKGFLRLLLTQGVLQCWVSSGSSRGAAASMKSWLSGSVSSTELLGTSSPASSCTSERGASADHNGHRSGAGAAGRAGR